MLLLATTALAACGGGSASDAGRTGDAAVPIDVGADSTHAYDANGFDSPDDGAETSAADANADEGADVRTVVDANDAPRDVVTDTASPDAGIAWDDAPIGWAAAAGNGVTTTTGGGSAAPVVVRTTAEFNTQAAGTTARVIEVEGRLDGSFVIGSNKTVIGRAGALLHGTIAMNSSVNVIVRNLTIVGYNCSDTTDCGNGADAITLRTGAHHIWIDHVDISDGSDGNLDVVSASDYITVSWTRFHYSAARDPMNVGDPHRFSNLIGASPTSTSDAGHLRVTFHHDWWGDNVTERMPRVRFGRVHVFDNLYTATGNNYCIGVAWDANVLAENNEFVGVHDPIRITEESSSTVVASNGNLFLTTSGSMASYGTGVFTPPYAYTLEDASTVRASVMAGAGPR